MHEPHAQEFKNLKKYILIALKVLEPGDQELIKTVFFKDDLTRSQILSQVEYLLSG